MEEGVGAGGAVAADAIARNTVAGPHFNPVTGTQLAAGDLLDPAIVADAAVIVLGQFVQNPDSLPADPNRERSSGIWPTIMINGESRVTRSDRRWPNTLMKTSATELSQ